MRGSQPGYLNLLHSGELTKRVEHLFALMQPCRLCPWQCAVDRLRGKTGICGASGSLRVAKAVAHGGEEPPLSGSRGSGALFFSHCTLRCCFCQNHQISHGALGREITPGELARWMLDLQAQGCHNINLVSATHFLPQAVEALSYAARDGLCLPVVYNSNGYEDLRVLGLLEGIVDIYLPDAKYADDRAAQRYSAAKDYCRINLQALQEMFRQVGLLATGPDGIAVKGLIVRHLVLPGGAAGTAALLQSLKNLLGSRVAISLMGQYTPCHKAFRFEELRTGLSRRDYRQAVAALESLGFENGWLQDPAELDKSFVPDFSKQDSWN